MNARQRLLRAQSLATHPAGAPLSNASPDLYMADPRANLVPGSYYPPGMDPALQGYGAYGAAPVGTLSKTPLNPAPLNPAPLSQAPLSQAPTAAAPTSQLTTALYVGGGLLAIGLLAYMFSRGSAPAPQPAVNTVVVRNRRR